MNGLKTAEGATLIGRGAAFRGELRSTEDVVIEGKLEGLVSAAGARVTVGREAQVRANLDAQEVLVLGRVEGDIRATERVELRSTAEVTGSVFVKRFAMEPDAVLRGRVDPTGGEAAAEKPAEMPSAKPVAVPSAAQAPAEPSGLFGNTAPVRREPGQLPSGLAAAARGLAAGETPAGLGALNHETVTRGE